MSENPTPAKRTATEAMRLKPATQRPGAEPEVARERTAGAIDALETDLAELRGRLDAVLELHSSALVGLCRECLTEHPCRTRRLAEGTPGTATPPEEGSQ